MKASPNTPSLQDVVKNLTKIRVDDYQRSYSWEPEQIDSFLEDLNDCVETDETHFFGSFIFQAHETNEDEVSIVDGQQRLTTIFIYVAAVRDRLNKLSSHIIQSEAEHLRPIDVRDKAWNFLLFSESLTDHRFESSSFLRDMMRDYVLAEDGNKKTLPARDNVSTLAFRKAVRHLRSKLSASLDKYPSDDQKLRYLNKCLDALFEKFIVLRVTTSNLTESLEIFLTLNNRGLPLGPSDLVRGEILSVLGADSSDSEHRKLQTKLLNEWKEIVDDVADPETFLRHYLVSTSEEKIQKKRIVQIVSDKINKDDDDKLLPASKRRANAKDFWNALKHNSKIYNKIIDPKMGGDIQYHLELMDNLLKSHRIFLLAVLDQDEMNVADPSEVIRLTMVLAYRWVMAGKNAQLLENLFQDLSNQWRANEPVENIITSLKSEIDRIDLDVSKYLINDAETGFIIKGLLYGIDQAIAAPANRVPLDKNKLHLEHIAPQNPSTDEWSKALFANNSAMDDEQYGYWVAQAGNLTILDPGINKGIGNAVFAEKCTGYGKSTLDVARDIKVFDTWNTDIIRSRNLWLAEMFDELFSISKPKKNGVIRFSSWWKQQAQDL